MSHSIEAIITAERPDSRVLTELGLPVFNEAGFNIIPLDVCHAICWGKKWEVYDEDGEVFGGVNLICLNTIEEIARKIGISNFIVIATDYHAGVGEQGALVYQESLRIMIEGDYREHYSGQDVIDINSALRYIGVIGKGKLDEFDSLNLSKYRGFDDYFEAYESYCED